VVFAMAEPSAAKNELIESAATAIRRRRSRAEVNIANFLLHMSAQRLSVIIESGGRRNGTTRASILARRRLAAGGIYVGQILALKNLALGVYHGLRKKHLQHVQMLISPEAAG